LRLFPTSSLFFRRPHRKKTTSFYVFQAMSVFADFALEQLNTGNTEVAHRAFGAVDLLAGSDSRHLQLANALVAEFIEAVHGDTAAVAAMGPMTKARLASY
jgi:hypothetical protein